MLKQGTVTLSSLTLLFGLLLLTHLSNGLMTQQAAISTSQTLRCGVINGESLATKEVAPARLNSTLSSHWRCVYQHPMQTLPQLSGETHESQGNSINLTAVIFCLLFLSAGLPRYRLRKYRTPKSIIECSSLLMSWIKPIKGTPS
ncbi:hypothetical protein GNT65_15760 [Shewanella sp. JBTF-M18]|uniref:Uncharacterized protein n=2 Tax=Shewanella insulae TaxID=2681496 RepID=A0A6L7I450_9GAMM|nr:hypothetical protein [Shewanella insulae]MXR70121.1 hypothetical protein [Shewanella insulae]